MTTHSGFAAMVAALKDKAPLQPISRPPHNLGVMRVGTVSHSVLTQLQAVGKRMLSHAQLMVRTGIETRNLSWALVKLHEQGYVRKWPGFGHGAPMRYSITVMGSSRLQAINEGGK
jgi:hypothetical protein